MKPLIMIARQESLLPEDTPRELHIPADYVMLDELIDSAKAHFGEDVSLSELTVDLLHFHARCIGYDLYDSMDWDYYIVLRRG